MKQKIISFKSAEPYFTKEKKGFKNNTVREIDMTDDRFCKLLRWSSYGYKFIEITKVYFPEENFTRKITDISFFKNFVIITWKHKK